MPDLSTKWLTCYQQLSALGTRLHQAQSSEELQKALQLAREANDTLQKLIDKSIGAAIAQLALIEPTTPTTTGRAIKSWVLGALWSRLKHWPQARRDMLGICVLLAACATPPTQAPAALKLAATLKKHQCGGIITTLLAGTFHNKQKRHKWQVHQDSPLLTLVLEIGQQLQPLQGEAPALEHVLAERICTSADEFELEQYDLLAQLAPTLYHIGRVAVDSQGKYWLLCAAEEDGYQALQYWPEQEQLAEHLALQTLEELAILPPVKLALNGWLNKIQRQSLTQPQLPTPNSLLQNSLYAKLSHYDFDAQLQLVEKQPTLTHFILENASDSNRQQRPVQRLRHALAIFGQEQLPLAVARAELAEYLQLQGSTQHAWLIQLQHVLHFCLHTLGRGLPIPINWQLAGVIASCCSAPLWHHPSLHAVPLSKMQQNKLLLGQLCQHFLLEPLRCQRLSAALLHHYRLNDWAGAVLRQYQQPAIGARLTHHETLGLFLRFCWQLTFSVFCDAETTRPDQQLLVMLSDVLSLPKQNIADWQQELLHCQQLFYPLDNNKI